MRGLPHWAGDAAVGVALAALGGALAVLAWPIPRGTIGHPGPGFMPLALGFALAGLGLACALRAVRARTMTLVVLADRRAAICLLALAGAAFALIPLGFIPTIAAFLAVLFGVLAQAPWWRAALYGSGASVALFLVFDRALGLGLPVGVWPF